MSIYTVFKDHFKKISDKCNSVFEKKVGNSDDQIFLTENGFSQPVGTFNAVTREAVLTTSLLDKTIIIEINNVCFDGNNQTIINNSLTGIIISPSLQNITIKNLTITSNDTGILVNQFCNCITISCTFDKAITLSTSKAIIIQPSRNINIINNTITNYSLGVVLVSNNINCNIFNNTINNAVQAIGILEYNTRIQICNNNITFNAIQDLQTGILLGQFNNNILISCNNISFENVKLTPQQKVTAQVSGITLPGSSNSDICVELNMIQFNNNNLMTDPMVTESFDLGIFPIILLNSSNNSSVAKNTIEVNGNTFDLNVSSVLNMLITNLFFDNCTEIDICQNTTQLDNNIFIGYQIPETSSETASIIINSKNKNIKSYQNQVSLKGNEFIPPPPANNQNADKQENSVFATFYLNNLNTNIKSIENNFDLGTNPPFGANAVFVNASNVGVDIIKTNVTTGLFKCFLFDDCNTNCSICQNKISDQEYGIFFNTDNNANVIKENCIEQCTSDGIHLDSDNVTNSINDNYVTQCKNAILFGTLGNTGNEIICNRFCKNNNDLVNISETKNFVFGNKESCYYQD